MNELTFDEMVACLEFWDMALACSNCGRAQWGEESTAKIEDFHADDCPLKGRRDVHEASKHIDYAYLDAECPDDHRVPPQRLREVSK